MVRELINSLFYPAGYNGSFGKYLIKWSRCLFFFFPPFSAYFCVLKSLCIKRLLEFSTFLTRTAEGSKKRKKKNEGKKKKKEKPAEGRFQSWEQEPEAGICAGRGQPLRATCAESAGRGEKDAPREGTALGFCFT